MADENKDNMDHFIRRIAKDPDMEYMEADWKKLEAMLDIERRRRPVFFMWRWKWIAVGIVTIIGIGGIYNFINTVSQEDAIGLESKEKEKRSIGTDNDSVMIGSPIYLSEQRSSVYHRQRESQIVTPLSSEDIVLNKDKLFKPVQNIDKKVIKQKAEMLQSLTNIPSKPKDNIFSLPGAKGFDKSPLTKISRRRQAPVFLTRHSSDNQIIGNSIRNSNIKLSQIKIDSSEKPLILNIPHTDSNFTSKKDFTPPPSRWSLIISYAPEFSSTGLNSMVTYGNAFGITTRYRLSKKLSLSTGLIKSTKKYWGAGNEFSPPKNFWLTNTNGIVPEKIKGNCSIIEIPLTLQYKLAEMKKSNLFVSAGVSSYFILNESYQFTFKSPNPGSKEGWSQGSSSGFPFSIITGSVGYEHNISSGIAIGIEPYIKIPIADIGWPDIKLFSVGASVTLRYNIPKKKHPPLLLRSTGPH
jgi:hypothetical protein